jgi:beta-lactamase class A
MEEGLMAAVLALAAAAGPPAGQEAVLWEKLRGRLQAIEAQVDGVLAVSVEDLESGRTIDIHAGATLATASSIKPAILLELYHAAAAARLDLAEAAPLPTPRVGGGGPLEMVGNGSRLTWRDLAALMMSYSDNDAANALIDRLGMEAIERRLQSLGLAHTHLRRRMLDRAAALRGDENVSTAAELRALMKAVHAAAGLPAPLAGDLRALAALPKRSEFEVPHPDRVRLLSKTGTLDGVRCFAAVVELPRRPYAIAVMAAHLRDEAKGEAAVREVAAEVLSTFERLALDSEYGRARLRE